MRGIAPTLAASVLIAGLSTLGDFIWATWIPQHVAVYGLMHGTLLFCAVGAVLGMLAGRPAAGAMAGAAIGAAAAGSFYLAAPFTGYSTMFVVWIGVWVALAFLHAELRRGHTAIRQVLGRGAIAAAGSGVAFYAISGIWRPFDPQGWDYLVHVAAWTLAYLPGFAALLLRTR